MSLMWMPAHTTVPPLRPPERGGNQRPTGAKIKPRPTARAGSLGIAGPCRAELAGECLHAFVAGAGESVHVAGPARRASWATMCAAAPNP